VRRLSGLRYIHEARHGARGSLIQEAFAVLGIAVGVALLFASQVSSTSLTHAVAQLNGELVGNAQVQLKARGYEGVSERLLAEVRAAPGVRNASPLLERQVNLVGARRERSAELIGIERGAFSGAPVLRRFSAAQFSNVKAIALPTPLSSEVGVGPYEGIHVQIGAKLVNTLVGLTLSEEDIGGLVHSPIAVTSLRYAQRLTEAPGAITRIFVRYEPGRARIAVARLEALARVWHVNLEPSDFESRVFAVAVAPQNNSEQLFSGISAIVGLMFALNAMLITIPSRRKLIRDLLPHGAAPTMIVLLVDAAVLGTLACVVGFVLGDLLSIAVFNSTPGYLTFAFPIGNARIVSWQAVALAGGTGMGAAVAGVLWPAAEVIWRSRERSNRRKRTGRRVRGTVRLPAGLLCLAFTAFALPSNTTTAVIGNAALVLALLCFLPFVLTVAAAIFARLAAVLDGVGAGIAASELGTPQTRIRYLAIAATAALAVFGTSEFGGIQANLTRGLRASIRGMDSSANLWVVPRGTYSLQTTVPFQPTDERKLAALPGVRHMSVYRGSFLDWGDRRLWVIAPAPSIEHPIPATQLLSGGLGFATTRVRGTAWAVLSKGLATEHHLRVGERFTLPSPHPVTFRLAGVSTNLGWPPGAIIMNAADYARAWGSMTPSAYEIQVTAGVALAVERQTVADALAGTRLYVETAAEREQLHYAAAEQGLSRLTQIRILIILAAILAVVGAIGALIWSRREQISVMKCHGRGKGELWRSLLCESGVVLAAGCLVGGVFSLYAQVLGSHTLSSVTGFPMVFDIEGIAAITSFAVVSLITLAVLAIPGYLVVRVPPSTASAAY
jgi:putative ABC transport system permease protein